MNKFEKTWLDTAKWVKSKIEEGRIEKEAAEDFFIGAVAYAGAGDSKRAKKLLDALWELKE